MLIQARPCRRHVGLVAARGQQGHHHPAGEGFGGCRHWYLRLCYTPKIKISPDFIFFATSPTNPTNPTNPPIPTKPPNPTRRFALFCNFVVSLERHPGWKVFDDRV